MAIKFRFGVLYYIQRKINNRKRLYCELVSIIGDISKLSYVSIVNISIMQVTPVFFINLVLCVSLNKKN